MLSCPMKDVSPQKQPFWIHSVGFWEAPSNSDQRRVANFRDAATGRLKTPKGWVFKH